VLLTVGERRFKSAVTMRQIEATMIVVAHHGRPRSPRCQGSPSAANIRCERLPRCFTSLLWRWGRRQRNGNPLAIAQDGLANRQLKPAFSARKIQSPTVHIEVRACDQTTSMRASEVQSGPAAFAYRTSTHLTTGVRQVVSEILTQRRPLGGTN
jgi:hypothetical protein